MVYVSKYCKYSNVYDTKHIKAVGYSCPYKHKEYHWPAKIRSNHCIIGDTIIKFLKVTNQAYVVAYPGINIDRLCWKIKLNKPSISRYSLIVLHVGTNDVVDLGIQTILNKYKILLAAVRQSNSKAIVGFSSIFPRPCSSKETNEKVILVNRELKQFSRQSGVYFIPSYRPFVNRNKEIITDLYAVDKLHLGFKGTQVLKKNLIGNIITIQSLHKEQKSKQQCLEEGIKGHLICQKK